ncbi:MAG: nucleotide exchange factor GrpE [Desulfobacteraceae bacterium]|nr:nucleotide exchange factor GrpE [Desulfobacteraceae bacterium]
MSQKTRISIKDDKKLKPGKSKNKTHEPADQEDVVNMNEESDRYVLGELDDENEIDDKNEINDSSSKSQADDQSELKEKLAEAETKSKDYYDRLLRLSAEFDNYKKRTSRQTRDLAKYANEKLVKEILSVVDNLERAIDAVSKEDAENNSLLQGVHLTLGEVLKILERHDVKPIKSLGQPFDPAYHQAMMQEEDDEKPANTIIREMQKGYMLHDRLLRPAMVGVSRSAENKS